MAYLIILFLVFITGGGFLFGQLTLREAAVRAFLVTFLVLLVITELLSWGDQLTGLAVGTAWIISLLLAAGFFSYLIYRAGTPVGKLIRESTGGWSFSLDWFSAAVAVCIFLILAVTGLIARAAPPNNFDSMTYHMPRVAHWIQNQGVRFYPTSIPRQNHSMPLAEFAILHLQLLSRSDRWANLVQWGSFLMAILLSTQIARELKLPARAQWFSGLVTAAIPMAVLQSTSTQNDLVVGVFCLSFAYFLKKAAQSLNWQDVFFASLSMGFALLTKGTAYLFCAAIGLSIGGLELIKRSWSERRRILPGYLLIIFLALFINAGHYGRNVSLYQHPLSTAMDRTTTDQVSAGVLGENLVRNGAVHLATPFPAANQAVNRRVAQLLRGNLNNPDSTFVETAFQVDFAVNEDEAGNLIHFLLLVIAVPGLLIWKKTRTSEVMGFTLAVITSILLFSLFLKWQPWGSRLQTPIFLLGGVLTGVFFSRLVEKGIPGGLLAAVLFLGSLPYLFVNTTRPLLPLLKEESAVYETKLFLYTANRIDKFFISHPGIDETLSPVKQVFYKRKSVLHNDRRQLYFMSSSALYDEYTGAVESLKGYLGEEVGLVMGGNDWEYPIWVFLDRHAAQGKPVIHHIMVENQTASLADTDPSGFPLLIVTDPDKLKKQPLPGHEIIYQASSIQVLYNPEGQQ